MAANPCPYLGGNVDLTAEREEHIAEHHPDLLPAYRERIIRVLEEPDQVRRSSRCVHARLFSRWFPDLLGGKYVVVVVMTDARTPARHWVVTAYLARRLAEGGVEWRRS
jgi:hypothetical protein